jgi:CheY-like chemotaxis protein
MLAINDDLRAKQNRLRILVVENDPERRDAYVEHLMLWGYEPVLAQAAPNSKDKHQSLVDNAIQEAHNNRCHLAIVDMRLKSDDDPTDISGLKLIPKLAPTVSIIVSGYGDRKKVRDALKSPPDPPERAADFIGKEDGPEALHNAIAEAVKTWWPCVANRPAIGWPYSIPNSAHLINRFYPDVSTVPPTEIDDLLWQLYPDAQGLRIEALESEDRTPSLGLRPRSVVVRIKMDDKPEPDIIKISRADRPIDEFQNYKRYVEGKFPRRYYATLKRVITLWDVRGAVYEYVGNWGRMTLFSEYYRSKRSEEVQAVLVRFGSNWKAKYDYTRTFEKELSLFQICRQVWGENWCERLRMASSSLTHASSDFQNWFTELGLADPVIWIKKRVNMDETVDGDHSPRNIPKAILHGDLQGDNCFVDEEHMDLWVIDYERSGPGPIFEDWVELENDILTRLACFNSKNRDEFLELATRVASSSPEEFWLLPGLATSLPEAIKALDVIREIRKQAEATTGLRGDERQYLWGLLLNIVFRLTLPQVSASDKEPQCDLSTIERCSLLGGVICRSLENGNRVWPPREWRIPGPSFPPPVNDDLQLAITLDGSRLTYKLNGGGKYTQHPVGQVQLGDSSRAILQKTFDRLSTLAKKTLDKLTTDERRQGEETLTDIGTYLYDLLLSDELKQEYLDFRESQAESNILIVSDDPWIPWEMVKPQKGNLKNGRGFDDPPLCEKFLLARWLSGPAAPNLLNLNKVVVVRPPNNLEAAQREQDYLLSLPSQSPHIREATPLNTVSAVLDSFRSGEMNLYHFACHGNFDQTDPDESRLKLEDDLLRVNQITGKKQDGLHKAKPLVFLNACYSGDLGHGLTRLGGWAQRFISSGASAFIGTLWAVDDQLAATFAIEFYNRLLGLGGHQAMPLARAFHDARLVIKQLAPSNPTWLAYVLYGNPSARFNQSPTQMRLF